MVVISAPLRAQRFKELAIEAGFVFVRQAGMKLYFENPGGDDEEAAAELKKRLKEDKDLAAVFFQVAAE